MTAGRGFDDISPGDTAQTVRIVTPDDLYVFAHVSGNLNPLNLPTAAAERATGEHAPAPSMWLASLFSAVLGNLLPGPGTRYVSQSATFHARVHVGDRLTVQVRVTEQRPLDQIVLATQVLRAGELVVDGTAVVLAPQAGLALAEVTLPQLRLALHHHVARLLAACADLPPMATAVVAPEEASALRGALEAAQARLITPILVGQRTKILSLAQELGLSLEGIVIEDVADDDQAAARAVAMVLEKRVVALMKGHLHTDVLLRHVVKSVGGLRTGRRISHVFVMDAPSLDELLFVTDAAINIAPTLEEKVDIVQNAIDLAHALGLKLPKVGVLCAVETVNPRMQATLDAAALSKMAERGQITGALVDGPLAMDNAISLSAAKTKGLTSLVAGRADILVVPNIEAGNILAKELTYAAQAEGAGLVLGARVPVMLTSRADDPASRLFSCAVAVLYAHWQAAGVSAVPAP